MKCKLLLLSAMLLLSFDASQAADSVAVWIYDKTTGSILVPETDTVFSNDVDGNPLSYEIRIGLENDIALGSMTLGFRIWSDDGLEWQYDVQPGGWGEGGQDTGIAAVTVAPGSRLDPPGSAFDLTQLLVYEKNIDGLLDDTLLIGGVSMWDSLSAGPMEHMLSVHFAPSLYGYPEEEIKTLCIDSAFVPPSAPWIFVDAHGTVIRPTFGPAICFPVKSSCPRPGTPWPVNPLEGAKGLAQPVYIDWDDVNGADKYQVQVDDHFDFSSPEIDIESVLSYYDASGLADGTWYWWRVRSHNSCDWGRWNNSAWYFMTEHAEGQLTDSVAIWLYDKAGGTILDDPATDTIFTVDSLGNPLSYEIRIALENDVSLQGMSLGFRIWSDSGVEWQYDAQPGGWGEGGQGSGFAAVTVAPGSRLDPPGDAFDVSELMITEQNIDGILDDTLVFGGSSMIDSLNAGPMEHMLSVHFTPALVGNDSEKVGFLCIDSAFTPPAVSWVFIDSRGRTFAPALGYAICFPVATKCPFPDIPLYLSPTDGAREPQPIHLDWSDVSGADKYQVQVDNHWNFSSPEFDSEVAMSHHDISSLADGTWYWWRVRAHNPCGWGDWNDGTRNFMTEHTGGPLADSVAILIYDKANETLLDPATDTIYTADYDGNPLSYEIRIALENDVNLGGMSLGFRIWSDDGVEWEYDSQPEGWGPTGQYTGLQAITVIPESRLDPPSMAFDMTMLLVTEQNVDGILSDTLVFGGVSMLQKLERGSMDPCVAIHFTPKAVGWWEVKTLCIDSAFVPPAADWIYANTSGTTFPPAIGPALCFPVMNLDACNAGGENSTVPIAFDLGQNYPNPFNPITTIEYDLPRAEQTTLEIFNLLGQRVRVLVNGIQRAGHHVIKWDGQDNSGNRAATGMYFYRLKSGNNEVTRKMILSK
jgi:hypothetical protein